MAYENDSKIFAEIDLLGAYSVIGDITIQQSEVVQYINYVQNQFIGEIKQQEVATVKNIEDRLQEMINEYVDSPVVRKFAVSGTKKVITVAVDYKEGGLEAGIISAVDGVIEESMKIGLGSSKAALLALSLTAGYLIKNETQAWINYFENKKRFEVERGVINNNTNNLKIISYTDDIPSIKSYLNESGFLQGLSSDKAIYIEVRNPTSYELVNTYEVIRGNKYDKIEGELNRRKFTIDELAAANDANYFDEGNVSDFIYWNAEPYILLEKNNVLYMPVVGNKEDNIIIIPDDAVETTIYDLISPISNMDYYLDETFGLKRYFVAGGKGNDTITGSTLNDEIYGESGPEPFFLNDHNNKNDSLTGGVGNDTILGQYGNDTLKGGADNDLLIGDRFWLYPDEGDETIGGAGNDVLEGGTGNDQLEGGKGNDKLYGGEDYDTYVFEKGDGQDVIIDSDGKGKIVIKDPGKKDITLYGTTDLPYEEGKWRDKNGVIYQWSGNDLVTAA